MLFNVLTVLGMITVGKATFIFSIDNDVYVIHQLENTLPSIILYVECNTMQLGTKWEDTFSRDWFILPETGLSRYDVRTPPEGIGFVGSLVAIALENDEC